MRADQLFAYDDVLFLQGRSPRFNLSHIAFLSAVSFGDVSCNAASACRLAARMKGSVLSIASFGIRRANTCSNRQGICSTADGVTSNPIGIPNQLMLMRLSYPQLGRVLFAAPSPYRNVARPGLADRRAMTSQCWTIMGGGRICTDDISKKRPPFISISPRFCRW